jgi:hypothetical protein
VNKKEAKKTSVIWCVLLKPVCTNFQKFFASFLQKRSLLLLFLHFPISIASRPRPFAKALPARHLSPRSASRR